VHGERMGFLLPKDTSVKIAKQIFWTGSNRFLYGGWPIVYIQKFLYYKVN
jgi:hypothetical protein